MAAALMFHVEQVAGLVGRVLQRLRAQWWRLRLRAPDPYRPLTDDELRRFFAAYPWTFAKTAVRNPHWYIVRGKNRVPDSLFEAVVQTIRDRGMPFWHWRKQYTIFVLDGFRYWTWGAPVGETTILNRAKHDA